VYEVVSTEVACKRFNFDVVDAVIRGPSGEFRRSWAHHEHTVASVAVDKDGRVPLIRQYRASVGRHNLELPGGRVDPGDASPADSAARELEEEVGVRAASVVDLGSFLNSPGHCSQRSLLFLATDLSSVPRSLDDGEEATSSIEYVILQDAFELIASGEVQDAKTIIGLTMAERRMRADR
jgi:8-oxo-dGTP pyrophosphatase MutT (NUDIX family)